MRPKKARDIMMHKEYLQKDFFTDIDEDIYDDNWLLDDVDADEVSIEEQGFMRGYIRGILV